MDRWVIKNKKGDFEAIAGKCSLLPVTGKLLCNRGIADPEEVNSFLHPQYGDLFSPFLMAGMDKACATIRKSISDGEKIRIIGDYDVDGVTSTYILLDGLKNIGANVDFRIPDRVKDGYGINPDIVKEAANDGIGLIVTCDNGIRAVDEIALAYSLGMKVVLTDHHDIPEKIPEAEAILNPKYAGCRYPYTELCGASVSLKLIEALNCSDGERHNFDIVKKYIELDAIATVCDVVELCEENRTIVKLGLEKLNDPQNSDCRMERPEEPGTGCGSFQGGINMGLQALINCSGSGEKEITAYQMGFVIGPCINASGRLDTAVRGLNLLCSTDASQAAKLAGELIQLNEERKEMTKQAVEEAERAITSGPEINDRVLVLLLENCHESIAGIVAGRLRERYDRPVIVLTYGMDFIKGSARSIEAYNITEELEKCSDLLIHFGGHAMAAGMSLYESDLSELRKRLNDNCTLTPEQMVNKISIDVVMPNEYASERLCREIKLLEPFGTGNPTPLFAEKNVEILGATPIGKDRQYLRLRLRNESGTIRDFVFFGDKEAFERDVEYCYGADALSAMYKHITSGIRLSITYFPEINEFRGNVEVNCKLKNYKI